VRRANYRGQIVLFPLGVVLLVAAALALAADFNRWLVFLGGVGCLGLIDDLLGGSPRGWRGHGRALVRGELSTGAIKAVGTIALAAYAVDGHVAQAIVLALAAHVGNLLDTRPGRSEKAFGLIATIACLASWSLGPLEPIAALIPAVAACSWLTLGERAMWGDSGASLIGGMAGVCLVVGLGHPGIYLALAGLIAISLYGEFRSISAAVDRTPMLRRLDGLGRTG
jgi:UDP-GlcNAc:undecaprenyl-phosphate GlcNAc-1-phosphate transferase